MANGKIAVLTDSTAYLADELIQEYGIEVIPLNVIWEGENYLDNVDIKSNEFYTRLQAAKELPTTSQPSAGMFKEYFDRMAKDADGIVAVLISEKLSGTIASAVAAKAEMGDFPIEIVDSKTTASGLGLVALEAAKAAKAGKSLSEVAARSAEVRDKVRTMFVVDTLEFLHKGGRIGGAKRLVGSMLSVKPILHITDGAIDTIDSVRTKKKALSTLLDIAKQEIDKFDGTVQAAVFHGLAEDEAMGVKAQVAEMFSPETLLFSGLSPVIGTHTGPGAIGVAFFVD